MCPDAMLRWLRFCPWTATGAAILRLRVQQPAMFSRGRTQVIEQSPTSCGFSHFRRPATAPSSKARPIGGRRRSFSTQAVRCRQTDPAGAGPRMGGTLGLGSDQWGSARVQPVLVGTLVVDISDARTGAIVWRSLASSDIRPTDKPERRDKKVAKATRKMFKNYPPQSR